MKNVQPELLPFTLPLTDANHQVAQTFYSYHDDPAHAKQVYLNALSVQAVHFFLSCIGIESQLEQSMSWDPALQALTNVADLWIRAGERVECCVMLPDMETVPVSAQSMSDRVGYLAVRLDAELESADILGFVPTLDAKVIETNAIALNHLQPLDAFPEYLATLATQERTVQEGIIDDQNISETSAQPSLITQLSQWLTPQIVASAADLSNGLSQGWKQVTTLIEELAEPSGLAYTFRQPTIQTALVQSLSISDSNPDDREHPPAIMVSNKLGKFLTLGDRPEDTLLFVVGITAPSTGSEMNISVEVYPLAMSPRLPQMITLAVLDEMGKAVLQAEGGNSEGLEFQFSGEPGERFSVRVTTQDRSIIEEFQI